MQADKEAGKFLEANTVEGCHGSGMFGIAFSAISSVAATGDPRLFMFIVKGTMMLAMFMSSLLRGWWYICCVRTSHNVRHTPAWHICSLTTSLDPSLKFALRLLHKQPRIGSKNWILRRRAFHLVLMPVCLHTCLVRSMEVHTRAGRGMCFISPSLGKHCKAQ